MEKLSMAVQDCFIRSLPDLYGFIFYARPKDDFLTIIETCQQKPLYSPLKGIDFNKDNFGWKDRYDFILSFNVLEKLMNPLHYLTEIRKYLRADGKLILTTAIDWKFWGKDNFREYDKIRLTEMLNIAEFNRIGNPMYLNNSLKCFDVLPPFTSIKKLRVPWWRMNSWKWPLGQFWYVEASK